MRYHEQLNIVFMRDNGPRRSIRVRRSRFYLLLAIFLALPFVCAALSWACWSLWQSNQLLKDNVGRFEEDYQAAEARAERLENLEELLREENVPGRDLLLRQLAATPADTAAESIQNAESPPETAEGPGHEEFPALDSGKIQVSNVVARAMRGQRIRISLDLRNPDPENMLSGEVRAILVSSAGEESPLAFVPEDVGNFRINRFKRTVMTARIPNGTNLADAQVILDVNDASGTALYRNIFQIRR